MSNYVYGEELDSHPRVNRVQYGLCDAQCRLEGAVTVVLIDGTGGALLSERWDGESFITYNQGCRINKHYERIVLGDDPYRPDWDMCIRLTRETPFPTEPHIERIRLMHRHKR